MEIVMKPIGEVVSVGEAKTETERFCDRIEKIQIYPEYQEGLTDIVPGKKLQILLNGLGYDCGAVDGDFGAKTLAAVKAFQKAQGLSQDGVVGANTWGKLLS